jgi:hypothetical protein
MLKIYLIQPLIHILKFICFIFCVRWAGVFGLCWLGLKEVLMGFKGAGGLGVGAVSEDPFLVLTRSLPVSSLRDTRVSGFWVLSELCLGAYIF